MKIDFIPLGFLNITQEKDLIHRDLTAYENCAFIFEKACFYLQLERSNWQNGKKLFV